MLCRTITQSFRKWKLSYPLFETAITKHSVSYEAQNKDDVHYFGFEKVSATEKRVKVQNLFSNVAEKYDLMNDVMTVGTHRLWKDYFIQTLAPIPGTQLLDVAGGTGDIAFRFLQAATEDNNDLDLQTTSDCTKTHVTVLDLNPDMLSICNKHAKARGFNNYLTCIQGNAELLPFPDNSFDAYTIAFGIRNVVQREEALLEALRILRPGGRFLCLEFSKVRNLSINSLYQWYSKQIIPVLGEVIAGEWMAYQYLIESIEKFPCQEEFSDMIQEAGFSIVTCENLLSGVAAIHSAYKL